MILLVAALIGLVYADYRLRRVHDDLESRVYAIEDALRLPPHVLEGRSCCNPNIAGFQHFVHANEYDCCCHIRPALPKTSRLPGIRVYDDIGYASDAIELPRQTQDL